MSRGVALAIFLAIVAALAVALMLDFFGSSDFRVWGTGLLVYLAPTGFALFYFTRPRPAPVVDIAARRQGIADVLTAKHEYGVHNILNAPITTDIEYKAWLNKEGLWTGDLLATMRERGCSKQEISDIEVLGLVSMGTFHADAERNHQLSMVALRLQRLKRIADHYAGRPADNVARYG
jgi:hypothetical protein